MWWAELSWALHRRVTSAPSDTGRAGLFRRTARSATCKQMVLHSSESVLLKVLPVHSTGDGDVDTVTLLPICGLTPVLATVRRVCLSDGAGGA